MPDTYRSFEELVRCEAAADYRVLVRDRQSHVTVVAPHGGRIEPGTSQLAETVAGESWNLFAFEGLKPRGNSVLHVTSTRFSHPELELLLARSTVGVSVHGMARRYSSRRWPAAAAALSLVTALTASPLVLLGRYYDHAEQIPRTNRLVLSAAEAAMRGGSLDTPVYLDGGLRRALTLSGGTLLQNLTMIFEVRGQAFEIVSDPSQWPHLDGSIRLVLGPASVQVAGERLTLQPLSGEPGQGARLRVFMATPRE